MERILLMVFAGFLLISCNNAGTNQRKTAEEEVRNIKDSVIDIHVAENSLDYWGTYVGVLPSASGEGIDTKLTLKKDSTFVLRTVYKGKEKNSFEEKGNYSLKGNTLTLFGKGENSYYKVGENQLFKLDQDKQVISGQQADSYILKKEELSL